MISYSQHVHRTHGSPAVYYHLIEHCACTTHKQDHYLWLITQT